jgi:hypothetical protein
MADKNENIHLFIIKELYARKKTKQNFNPDASSLEAIFGANWKTNS